MTKEHKDASRKSGGKSDPRSAAQARHTALREETAGTPHHAGGQQAHTKRQEGPAHSAEDVFHAFRKGREDAIDAAERALPGVKRSVSKGTYMFCYYLSFGAVFTAAIAMSFVPEDSVVRHGFRDGAAAARDAYAHCGAGDPVEQPVVAG